MQYNQPYDQASNPNAPYVNGNPASGVQGSIIPAAAVEYTQREIVALIQAGGLTPANGDLSQAAKAVQSGKLNYAVAGGSANALTATLNPAPDTLTAGLEVTLSISTTNTNAVTLNLNGHGLTPVVGDGSVALKGGELSPGLWSFTFDGTNFQVRAVKTGRLLRTSLYFMSGGIQYVSINGGTSTTAGASTFTPLASTTTIEVEVIGGGGGGGGGGGQGAGTYSLGGGGGGGAWGWGIYPAQSAAITIGPGGSAGNTAPTVGGNGGTSSFGSLITAPGGGSGPISNTIVSPNVSQSGSGAAIATGGIVNAPGGAGLPGAVTSGGNFAGGGGANGKGNPGSGQPGPNTAGFNAVAPGTGGSGADVNPSSGGLSGGTGAAGQILVKEYA
jgi:hypothetical protein